MKNWRKAIVAMLCFAVILGTTACGGNNTNDDGANTPTEQNDTNNDVTEGTDNGGVIDDVGDAAGNAIDDIGNGVENITDDITGNGTDNGMQNGTGNGTTNNNR